jgi:hypothetical protein
VMLYQLSHVRATVKTASRPSLCAE